MRDMSQYLYTASQIRNLDRLAMQELHDDYRLMCRAGKAAYHVLRARWPGARRITVFCGAGNNGGDGYVVARLARQAGITVQVVTLGDAKTATAKKARDDFLAIGGETISWSGPPKEGSDVIVDGLLGTGLEREVTGVYASVITCINDADSPVLALDIPSGIHTDRGMVMGCAIRADVTVTFVGNKIGLHTGAGPGFVGEVVFDDLGVSASVYATEQPYASIISPQHDGLRLPPRVRTAHKGTSGRVLLIGSDIGMPGAIGMAAQSAYRCGAGLVQVATRPDHATQIITQRPETMIMDAEDSKALAAAMEAADVIAIGPGLGTDRWGSRLFGRVFEIDRPLVLDADALNLLAANHRRNDTWVLTPHPGEAGRLLGSKHHVNDDRVEVVQELQRSYGGVAVLKGAGTLVADGQGLWLCDRGNPGMASGGMGDVLTGVVAALIAQGQTPSAAARYGVWLHATAADMVAAARGEIGLMATDLLLPMQELINQAP